MTSQIPSTLAFVVPGRPVPWQRTATGADGHRHTPKSQRDYQAHVKACAWAELLRRGFLHIWPANGRYAIDVEARVADYRARDCDNFAKQAADALQGLLWINDCRIDDQRSRRFIAPANLGLTVRVEVLVAEWQTDSRTPRRAG